MGWAVSLLFGPTAFGQTPEPLPSGLVVRSVPVAGAPEQSYSLYLPSSYHPAKKWPVLFAFDPRARGTLPVECFREAAEEYGYVVAGSNVSRNGPMNVSMAAGVAMINDVGRRFSINEQRVYATGFSGGARVASAMGREFAGKIAGVIGCGAGYPAQAGPRASDRFVFCGVIGNKDFNWIELNQLDRTLGSLRLPHRTLRFAGGHRWPPPETARAAIEWLELQAMRSGRRPRDETLVSRLLRQELDPAQARESAGDLAEAWARYADLVAAFEGLFEVGPYRAKVASLGDHKLVKAARKRQRDEEASEVRQMSEIQGLLLNLEVPERLFERRTEVREALTRLAREEASAKTEAGKLQARRLLEHASVTAFYTAQPLIEAKRFAAAVHYLEVQVAVHPESAEAQYRLAAVAARAGDKRRALEALEAAVSNGLSDASRIEGEEAFTGLRKDRRFRDLLEKLAPAPKLPSAPHSKYPVTSMMISTPPAAWAAKISRSPAGPSNATALLARVSPAPKFRLELEGRGLIPGWRRRCPALRAPVTVTFNDTLLASAGTPHLPTTLKLRVRPAPRAGASEPRVSTTRHGLTVWKAPVVPRSCQTPPVVPA